MSETATPIRNPNYRFIFPPPAYCAYTGGAIPVKSTDTRPATATNAYPAALCIPVNAPAYKPIHVEDVVPVVAAVSSPYPPSSYRVLPAAAPIHTEDVVPRMTRSKRS